ncbi:MAG: DNA topoisomerase IV, partial [Chlamydiae bacterium CG10_big_fil_rev_8_21_14_0_10_42_34]
QYAEELVEALYAFTDCEVSLNSQVIVIKEGMPWETDIHEVLAYNATKLVEFLKLELEIDRDRLLEKIFYKTLERIFIENRLYKKIETVKTLEGIHDTLTNSFKPYRKKLQREPTQEDREKLLQIPIRRISQFDIDKNKEEIAIFQENLADVEKHLKNVKKFTIQYLKNLIEKYGKDFPRKTKIKALEEVDIKAISTKEIKVGFDPQTCFVGTKVSGPNQFECTNFDKLLVFSKDGTYRVMNIPEKQYYEKACWAGVADKKTVMSVVYKNKETGLVWAKRFIVEKFILEKSYRYLDENAELLQITESADTTVELNFAPQGGKKTRKMNFALEDVPIKGAQTRGVRLANRKVKKVVLK